MNTKEIRTELGLNQAQFALKVGVSKETVNRWENGKHEPSNLSIIRIKELEHELKVNDLFAYMDSCRIGVGL